MKIKAIERINVCSCYGKGLLGIIIDNPKDNLIKMMKDYQLVLTTDPRLIKAWQLCNGCNEQ